MQGIHRVLTLTLQQDQIFITVKFVDTIFSVLHITVIVPSGPNFKGVRSKMQIFYRQIFDYSSANCITAQKTYSTYKVLFNSSKVLLSCIYWQQIRNKPTYFLVFDLIAIQRAPIYLLMLQHGKTGKNHNSQQPYSIHTYFQKYIPYATCVLRQKKHSLQLWNSLELASQLFGRHWSNSE